MQLLELLGVIGMVLSGACVISIITIGIVLLVIEYLCQTADDAGASTYAWKKYFAKK